MLPIPLIKKWLLCITLGAQLASADTSLLNDQFTDKERYYQNPPESTCWYYVGGQYPFAHLNTDPAQGTTPQLRLVSTGGDYSAAMALAYFTTAGSPKALAAGESLTLEFNVRLDRLVDSPGNFRFALFNSKGVRPFGDVSNSTYEDIYSGNHDGYQVVVNTGAAAGQLRIYERNNQGNTTPFALNEQAVRGTNDNAALNLPVKKSFPVKLVVARSTGAGSSITLTATVNGVTVSGSDTSSLITSFDGLGVFFSGNALGLNQELRIDEVTVRHSTASALLTTLLNDSFDDRDRANQSLPTSAQWFYNGPNNFSERCTAAASVPNTELSFGPGGVDAMAITYFTNSGTRALAIGESLSVQASLRLDLLKNAPAGVRLGVFNSRNVRTTDDIDTGIASTTTFNAYRGYDLALNPAGGEFNIYRRATNGAALFNTTNPTLLGASNATGLDLVPDPEKVPRLSLTITRTGTSTIRLEGTINGRSVVRTDTAATTTSFDTLALFASTAAFPYDGPQITLDRVSVVYSPAPASITSQGKIVAESFNSAGWSGASFSGLATTGTATSGAYGTIDILGSVTPSGGARLTVDSSSAVGAWSGEYVSGLLPVTNSETALNKLTLAFDLLASTARPVRVRVESVNSSGVVGGVLERIIYPAAANAFQRYATELSSFTLVSGTFDPMAPNLQIKFAIEGGNGSAEAWPTAENSLQIDNVYYARPAYYVRPGGNNSLDGRTEANAFGTIARALELAGPGDIVLLMDGNSSPAYTLSAGLYFSRGGSSAGWVTVKNYPGQSPLVYLPVLENSPYYTWAITAGYPNYLSGGILYPGYFDFTTNLNYIEIRGFRMAGASDQLPEADQGQATGKSNVSGISIDGRYMALSPHHIRVADMEVSNFPGGGVGGGECDWIYFENNLIHDTSNWTIYASSGVSVLAPFNFDGTAGTHRIFWLGNRIYRNETKKPWEAIGAISDGNGAILDTFLSVERGPYLGRAIVANNLLYENGGSGVHALKVNGADIVHNTIYRNSHSPALQYASVFAYDSNDIIVANNIVDASPGEPLNDSGYSNIFPRTTGIRFFNNLYFSEGTATPYSEANDVGNRVATVAAQVGFVDGPGGDFRLRTGSLAFDGGISSLTTYLSRDFYGVPRRFDGIPDIGAINRLPLLLDSPNSTAIDQGGSATFNITAQGAGPNSSLAYQWQQNGVNLIGQNAAQLTISNALPTQAGVYRVRVAHQINGSEVDAVFSSSVNLSIANVDLVSGSIPLTNPSFEAGVVYNGGATSSVSGWSVTNGGSYGNVQANTNNRLFISGVTGNNAIFLGGGIAQTTTARYVKGVTYILSVDAGQPLGASGATGFLYGFLSDSDTDNYGLKPFGIGSTFAGIFPTAGVMQTYSLAYTATDEDAGKLIKIGFYDYFSNSPLYRIDNVTVSSVSTFTTQQSWRQSFFGTTDNLGNASDLADPDNDGIVNLLEYAFHSNPLTPGNQSSVLPNTTLGSDGHLTFSFLRSRSDLSYTVQGSSDLNGAWTDLSTNPGFVSMDIPVIFNDSSSNPGYFLRLKISTP